MVTKKSKIGGILLPINRNVDKRGEVIKIMTAQKAGWPARDIIVASMEPGVVRGNHYHKKKEEIYVVISGPVMAKLVDVKTGKRKRIRLDGKNRRMLFIHPYVAHALKNVGYKTAWFAEVQNTDYTPKDDFKYDV